MSIQIQKVYQETQAAYQLHPLTGDAGMTREFSWVQLCEDIENIKFFRGNELVITTGLMSDHETWMKSFVERLIRYRASGLILNVGKYVTEQEVTEGLLDYCEQKDFPVFTMPWRQVDGRPMPKRMASSIRRPMASTILGFTSPQMS